jgi:diaminopimelate decarboxylase
MEKKPFVTKEQIEEIVKTYPTPFHLYDEKGIRENARKVRGAFSWNPGFREYFAVKATPNPFILKILQEEGCGTDCATKVELMMAKACCFTGDQVFFSSNVTPAAEYAYAKEMGPSLTLMT